MAGLVWAWNDNGFPAILVRLTAVDVDELEELILDAWRCQAPPSLRDSFHVHGDA